jgi:hypothetical protein
LSSAIAAPTGPPAASRPRRLRRRLALLALALGASLAVAELAMRAVGGYRLFSATLVRVPMSAASKRAPFEERIRTFLQASRSGVDTAWFDASPPRVERGPVRPEHRKMRELWAGPPHFYFYNAALIASLAAHPDALKRLFGEPLPESLLVFDAGAETEHPRFRYPPDSTLPDGLVTNRFGFRGPQIALEKPPRTVRIACVGASTTVDDHGLPWSYPELIQHWLSLWARARGLDLAFEVINAGREAIVSTDILAVVRQELLPLAVDYVVYYEGANQFDLWGLFRAPDGTPSRQSMPPPGLVPAWPGPDPDEATWLYALSRCSAVVERLRSALVYGQRYAEPIKPRYRFAVPAGIDEMDPPLDRLDGILQTATITQDLDAMRGALAAADARLVVCTFAWSLSDGMTLDAQRQRAMFAIINRAFWPLTYANVVRAGELENRVFRKWAAARGVDLVDVAARMPRDPDLFTDTVHNTELGVRFRAWTVFERLVEIVARDVAAGTAPNARKAAATHPAFVPPRRFELPR